MTTEELLREPIEKLLASNKVMHREILAHLFDDFPLHDAAHNRLNLKFAELGQCALESPPTQPAPEPNPLAPHSPCQPADPSPGPSEGDPAGQTTRTS